MIQILPAALVPVARGLISSQGGNPNIITSEGSLDPAGIVGLLFNKAEVRSTLSDPIVFPIVAGGPPPDPTTQAILQQVQPSVVLSGPGGTIPIAPYGVASGVSPEVGRSGIFLGLGIGAALLGLLFIGGALFRSSGGVKLKRRRR